MASTPDLPAPTLRDLHRLVRGARVHARDYFAHRAWAATGGILLTCVAWLLVGRRTLQEVAWQDLVWLVMALHLARAVTRRWRHLLPESSVAGAHGSRSASRDLTAEDRHACAQHEASHAVAAHVLGLNVRCADILIVGSRDGRVEYAFDNQGNVAAQAWAAVVTAAAGMTSDQNLHGAPAGSQYDFTSTQVRVNQLLALGFTNEYVPVGASEGQIWSGAGRAARDLLAEHADTVARVRDALLEHHCLTGEHLSVLLDGPADVT